MTDEQRLCGKHVAGTSSNRCLLPPGHSGAHSDEFEEAPGLAELRAERDLLLWLHAEAEWQRDNARDQFLDHYNGTSGQLDRVRELETALRERTRERDLAVEHDRQPYPTAWAYEQACRVLNERTAERDLLQARIDTIAETLGRACHMMATDSRDWSLDRSDVWLYGLIVGWECEDDHLHEEWCGGGEALRQVAAQHGWEAEDIARIRRFRAALKGEQPAKPERQLGVDYNSVRICGDDLHEHSYVPTEPAPGLDRADDAPSPVGTSPLGGTEGGGGAP